ncbi:MAG: hypothetical protein V7L20_14980 [Nostoc sp.]|uniref:hypothetical protein n=1 Tax=Nostoc sp. TaxID=1180 RepID=UPI002FFAA27A
MKNKQIKDLYSIDVQDLSHEAAATVSGGIIVPPPPIPPSHLDFSDLKDGKGAQLNDIANARRSLGKFNNKASWYKVTGPIDWIVYTGENFTGKSRRLKANSSGNFTGPFNNDIASVKRAS